jgi:hypothetical protein
MFKSSLLIQQIFIEPGAVSAEDVAVNKDSISKIRQTKSVYLVLSDDL